MGILWEFFGNSLEHVGLSVLYMLRITVGIFYMMSHDTNYGYKKILGLRGDRQTDRQKRSLEARADAFSRLKIVGAV